MSSILRLSNPVLEEMGFDPIGLRQPITVNIEEQLVNTRQYFPDNGIEGARIENLSVAKLKAGTLTVDTYIQSTGYVAGSSGWRIDGQGNAEFNNLTLTGGSINFGKTSFSDATNAGYIIDSNGVYFGSALDARYLKYTIATGAFELSGGTIDVGINGSISGGQTDYDTGTGFFLGYSGGAYKLSIGDGTVDNSLTWNGSILTVNGSGVTNNDVFGSGEDGNVTISSNTTLTQDKFYNNLTINSGFTLTTAGYRVFVKGTLTINSTGKIAWNGNNGTAGQSISGENPTGGTGGAGGSALTTASLAGSVAGRAGGNGGAGGNNGFGQAGVDGGTGTAGGAVVKSFRSSFTSTSANGGAGGTGWKDGNPTFFAAGAAGVAGAAGALTSASVIRPYCALFGVQMFDMAPGATAAALTYNAGCGGAGGGGGGASSYRTGNGELNGGGGGGGGGSGSGGGTIVIAARTIVNNGSIEAVGGNGGNGGTGGDGQDNTAPSPNEIYGGAGGGGGGGGAGGPGGVIVLIYSSISGSGTTSVAAGASGTGGAGGTGGASALANGANGTAGTTATTAASGKIITLIV